MPSKKQLELSLPKSKNNKILTPLTPAVFHVLMALADGPAHGYAILRSADASAAPEHHMGAGTVYGTLKRLEQSGHVRATTEGKGKRRYGLTPLGHQSLWAESSRLVRLAGMVQDRGLVGGGRH